MANEVTTRDQTPYAQLERMAQSFAKSNMFGVKTPEQALTLMLIAQAEGYSPALAARDYHIIQGRPTLKADTMLARFQAAGGKVEWSTYTDTKVVGVFSHPQSGSVTIEWDLERAEKVKTWNSDDKKWVAMTTKDNWQNYPRAMLKARVISEGVRACFPGVAIGTYTVEEAQDMTQPEEKEVVSENVAAKQAAQKISATALTPDEIAEHAAAMCDAPDPKGLRAAFTAASKHAEQADDGNALLIFKRQYDVCLDKLKAPQT